jgi:hypothetical protein
MVAMLGSVLAAWVNLAIVGLTTERNAVVVVKVNWSFHRGPGAGGLAWTAVAATRTIGRNKISRCGRVGCVAACSGGSAGTGESTMEDQ